MVSMYVVEVAGAASPYGTSACAWPPRVTPHGYLLAIRHITGGSNLQNSIEVYQDSVVSESTCSTFDAQGPWPVTAQLHHSADFVHVMRSEKGSTNGDAGLTSVYNDVQYSMTAKALDEYLLKRCRGLGATPAKHGFPKCRPSFFRERQHRAGGVLAACRGYSTDS